MVRLYIHKNEATGESHIVNYGFILYRNSRGEINRSRDSGTLEDIFCNIART